MTRELDVKFRFRRGEAALWTTRNPILEDGEPGFETDGKLLFKLGDGFTSWNDLDYAAGGLSAYEIAVRNGYLGTEEDWLESLIEHPGQAFIDEIVADVMSTLEPQVDLVVLFDNILQEGV